MAKEMMSWESCLLKHIQKVEKDNDKAHALLKMAELRIEFWSQEFNTKYTSLIVDGYYETIKELLTAMLSLEGYKSDNHECLIAYLKEHYPELAYEIQMIYQLKTIRNDIDYKGFFVKKEYLQQNKLEFNHIIELLQKKIKEKL